MKRMTLNFALIIQIDGTLCKQNFYFISCRLLIVIARCFIGERALFVNVLHRLRRPAFN